MAWPAGCEVGALGWGGCGGGGWTMDSFSVVCEEGVEKNAECSRLKR